MTATRRTGTDQSQGDRRCTVSHVPPEVWSNINKQSDKFYDIYSFGICVWEMLAGSVPYGSEFAFVIIPAQLVAEGKSNASVGPCLDLVNTIETNRHLLLHQT